MFFFSHYTTVTRQNCGEVLYVVDHFYILKKTDQLSITFFFFHCKNLLKHDNHKPTPENHNRLI